MIFVQILTNAEIVHVDLTSPVTQLHRQVDGEIATSTTSLLSRDIFQLARHPTTINKTGGRWEDAPGLVES